MRKLNLKHIAISMIMVPLAIAHPIKAQPSQSILPSTDSCLGCSVAKIGSEVEKIEDILFNFGVTETFELAHEEDREEQVKILEKALEIANTLDNLSERVSLFSDIAIKYANMGDRDRALDLLLRAQELANTVEDPQQRSILLSEIALKEAELQPKEIAAEKLIAAKDIANTIEDPQQRIRLLSQIALKLVEIGETDTREIANSIEDPQQRVRLLSQIALKLAELGETDRAAAILSEIEDILRLAQIPEGSAVTVLK